eukprot:gene17771-23373_t
MDFLSKDNICGQNLIRIVSRGSAIVTELLRLSSNIPDALLSTGSEQIKYHEVLFDFHYLRDPEEYERKINASSELLELDIEFQENHIEILKRFYLLFESIYKYQFDLSKYVEDVKNGYYIHHSVDSILDDVNGKQLLSESLYLYGVMLLLMEELIPGHIREKILISLYRNNNDGSWQAIDEVIKLCRNTGYIPKQKKPKNHPEALFSRYAPDEELVRLVIGSLQTDDIYHMSNTFPNPDHRSTRLAVQASMLYVILYFSPKVLHKEKTSMREIVDKYFNDNWIISIYMGRIVDLTVEWQSYSAAKSALDNVISDNSVRSLDAKNAKQVSQSLDELKAKLKEGVLVSDYLLDNMKALINIVRECNVSLRWRLLHRRCSNELYSKIISNSVNSQTVVSLLLNVSQFEYVVKGLLQQLLDNKTREWSDGQAAAALRLTELSEYFTGEKALTRVKRDEKLMNWFRSLSEEVNGLSMDEDKAVATGRKIQGLIVALEDVEQFEAVDTNIQIKSFLNEARDIFRQMIRIVNVKSSAVELVETLSDLSYAWEILPDYLPVFHDRIRRDPTSVVLLRATFLKTASILDVPLIRITAIDSPDLVSVAEHYSAELVEFVRKVLEVIPQSVFRILSEIEGIQTHRMTQVPIRLEAKDLKDFSQLDLRYELAKLTHQVSVFTEGILLMEKTLLGVIQVEPRQILEEGLRRELVRLIASAMHTDLTFPDLGIKDINQRLSKLSDTLQGIKRSIEYLQDYIGIAGLKMYQEELARVINYNTEQEANRYLKKKTFDSASRYQSKAIPIPRLVHAGQTINGANESGALNFMGRVLSAVLYLTDATRTSYAPESSAWYVHNEVKGQVTIDESCGIRTFAILEGALGAIGLRGLDRLLSFRTVFEFNNFKKFYEVDVSPFKTLLDQVRESLFPEYKVVPNASKTYGNPLKKTERLMLPLLQFIRRIGQAQLIRRQIASQLQWGCQLDAHLLHQALDTLNNAVMSDVRQHYRDLNKPYPDKNNNPLLFELSLLTEACGLDDPLHKIYITTTSTQPLEGIAVLLFLFLLTYLPKLDYDCNLGALVRKKTSYPLDGIPLVIGLCSFLKQLHPAATLSVLGYLGQFVRTTVSQVFSEADSKVAEMPSEVLNTLVFIDQICRYGSIPRSTVYNYIPPYIFDAIRYKK